MKIIDNRKDFYDFSACIYDTDERIAYVRKTVEYQKTNIHDDVLIEIPSLELERNEVTLNDLELGRIMFDNRMYEVYFIQPRSVFADMVVTYSISCRGVEVI